MCNSREHPERRRAAKARAFCGGKFELIPRDARTRSPMVVSRSAREKLLAHRTCVFNNFVMGGCVLEASTRRSCLGCRSAFVDQLSQGTRSGTGWGSSPPPFAGPGAAREVLFDPAQAGQSDAQLLQQLRLLLYRDPICRRQALCEAAGRLEYILIPLQKIERNRDNPDGRNHLCAPPPALSPADTVYCFASGGAT
jgi:hypothetical protein